MNSLKERDDIVDLIREERLYNVVDEECVGILACLHLIQVYYV